MVEAENESIISILVGMVHLLSAIVSVSLHMCTNNCIHLIVNILYITSLYCSTFYRSQDTSWVQGFIFEGDLQFSKLFKMTTCKGMCTLKCTENVSSFLPPSICSINLSSIQNLKEAQPMIHRMYSIIHLSKIIHLLAFKSLLFYPPS
jgi:hypothetical protein